MILKKKLCGVVAAVMLAGSMATVPYIAFPQYAEAAKYISPDRERLNGQNFIAEQKKLHKVEKLSPTSYYWDIMDKIIKANPNKLNYDDGKHDRWVSGLYWSEDTDQSNAFSNGGYILVTAKKAYLSSLYDDGEHEAEPRDITEQPNNIYLISSFATDIAHELAHFECRDSAIIGDKRNPTKVEYDADQEGMRLADAVPEYSMGAFVSNYFHERHLVYINDGKGDYHPSWKQYRDANRAYIEKISKGRVKLDEDCRLTVDGKLFMGTGYMPSSEYSDYRERTAYLAGQIASCIQRGIWKRENLGHSKETRFFIDGNREKTTLAVWNSSDVEGNPVKLLGTFDFSEDSTKESRNSKEQQEVDCMNYIMDLLGPYKK